jgi:hypothetical protein
VEVDFALLTDGTAQRPDGKFDLYGAGFDTIWALGTPARHATMTLAVRVLLSRHEAERGHQLQVILMNGDGQELGRIDGQVAAVPNEMLDQMPAGRRLGLVSLLQFANLVFPTFGPYQFVLHWDGNEAKTIPLYIERVQQPEPPDAPPEDLPELPAPNE